MTDEPEKIDTMAENAPGAENVAGVENTPGTSAKPTSFFARPKAGVLMVGTLALALLGAAIVVTSSTMANLNENQQDLSRALAVTTTPIRAVSHYQVEQKYSGNIVARQESDHGFDISGLLAEVLVDEGSRVKKGDILARLDMRRFGARARELDAGLAEAVALNQETTARLDRAQATYDRYEVLLEKQHISEQKFEQVKFDLIALKARKVATESAVAGSKATLRSLEIDRDLATLTARFDGSVVRRYLDEGAALGPGTAVLRLIEDQMLEIHVGLPQRAIASLVPGDTYIFDHQGHKVPTILRAILAQVDQSTRTVTAIFGVTGHKEGLRAGGLAQLTVKTTLQQAGFWLPSSALAESRRGLWSVYTLKPYQGSPEYATLARQELQVLHTDANRVFVRGTLQDGDLIVAGGTHRLVPGQLVRIVEGQ